MRQRARITPTEIRNAGWTRVDPRPWSKCGARWAHPSGWIIVHCGHPTALWPWALYDPSGALILTGADAEPPNPTFGKAWASLAEAIAFVAKTLARAAS